MPLTPAPSPEGRGRKTARLDFRGAARWKRRDEAVRLGEIKGEERPEPQASGRAEDIRPGGLPHPGAGPKAPLGVYGNMPKAPTATHFANGFVNTNISATLTPIRKFASMSPASRNIFTCSGSIISGHSGCKAVS